ncbi:hypothetical protein MLD38_031393 [Melastoma candidum]|uniref:Uncharacterized protein n=1 Tax=Melastoma candidum TaxID=119954 RepID=A0ACB9MQ31_9MYRT|nr:hypothetical protein MLD38_031393 [Melastoma candidum]
MMQYSSEAPTTAMINNNNHNSTTNTNTAGGGQILPHRARPPWPGHPTSRALAGLGDATSMERLLVNCAAAIESNDATLAQQILWVLNNITLSVWDPNQRLTCSFLRALILRAARNGTCKVLAAAIASSRGGSNISLSMEAHRFSIVELAAFVDLTPWYRFGFTAANAAVVDAVEGYSSIHIVDLGSMHCMQIPTLIDAIASKFEVPPSMRLTVVVEMAANDDGLLPINFSYEELGSRLVNFARSRNVNMEFRVVVSSRSNGFSSLIEDLRKQKLIRSVDQEALVVNCHMMLHYIPEDQTLAPTQPMSILDCGLAFSSPRTTFLHSLRSVEPTIMVLVEEDADLTSNDVVTRLRSAFNYLWIPYDTADTIFPRESEQREWYESHIRWRIENVVAREGGERVERLEGRGRWGERLRGASFRGVGFGEEAVAEVKAMLDEHANGWGMKREEDDLVLTWKGHNVVFASAWLPA